MALRVVIITDYSSFQECKTEWNRCLEQSSNNRIYGRHEWFQAVILAEKIEEFLHIILVKRNEQIVGIAPMMFDPRYRYHKVTLQALRFIENKETPENVFITLSFDRAKIIRCILDYLCSFEKWRFVLLGKVLQHGEIENVVNSYFSAKTKIQRGRYRNIESPLIETLDWENLFNSLTKNRRKNIRRITNKARRELNISVEKLKPTEDRDNCLEMICAVSRKSWKKEINNDLLSDPRQIKFYKEICDRLGEDNIELWLLKNDDEIIAFEFLLIYRSVAYPIRADFDSRYNMYSPGTLLMSLVLEEMCKNQEVEEYHTCAHTYDYLMVWSKETRQYVNLEIFSTGVKSKVLHYLKYIVLPRLRNGIKNSG